MFLVFIGGQSASGKTGLSQHLLNKLQQSGTTAQILNMDDYYHERPDDIDPEEYRLNTNFDTPDMLYLDLLSAHLRELGAGKAITKPLFEFKTNRRKGEETIQPSEVVIIEGLFAQHFYNNFLPSELSALSVNIATDTYLDIVERRVKRDIAHRGRKREDVVIQERKYVGPGFLKYTASNASGADIYISNPHQDTDEAQNLVLDAAADEVYLAVNKKLKELTLSTTSVRRPRPNVQEMVAKSHLIATKSPQFKGYFNGVFGTFKGDFEKEFSQEEINRTDLIAHLRKYINRINQHKELKSCRPDFKYNFWFCKNSRAANREANYYLAEKLLQNLSEQPDIPIHEVFADIIQQRAEIIAAKKINTRPDFVDRDINSAELKAIISKANIYDPAPARTSTQGL